MSKKFPVHWLEEIVNKLSKRNTSEIILATGKTPSGYIHLGILREILICDALRRIFEDRGKTVNNLLFFDSLDAAKRFPAYIPENFQKEHIGKPFALMPCPFENCQCESYAHHFGNALTSAFNDFGIKTSIIWTHELYKKKEMQKKVKVALENIDDIKRILRKYILPTLKEDTKDEFIEMQKDWMPVMAICEKCNRTLHIEKDGTIKPNRIKEYNKDREEITYNCEACGYKGTLSIWSGKLKLNWRIDWPAKWALFNTTCEPAGKDHSVKGGAYDTGIELCQVLYNYEGPVKVPYEWLRLGDYDMKTSKGIVFTPKKYLEIADPEVYRAIILRTNPMKHIAFRIEELSQYYDYYNRMENFYYQTDGNGEEYEFFQYLYPLTQIQEVSEKKVPRIPLKLLIFLAQIQNILDLGKLYKKAKEASNIEDFENYFDINIFELLLKRTTRWLNEVKKVIENLKDTKEKRDLIRKINLFSIPEKINSSILEKLDENQKKGISILKNYLKENETLSADLIQNKIFTIAKEDLKISPKKLFEGIYLIIIGKKFGPRLGPFLSLLDKKWLLDRLDIY